MINFRDDKNKIRWQLLLIYGKMVSEITIIIGFFIIFFLILKRAGVL